MLSKELKLDWVNLPPDVIPESLGLHDAELLCVHSNLLQRSIDLEVDAPELRDYAQMGGEGRFMLHLQDVESARVTTWAVWPGPSPEVKGIPIPEQNGLVKEYQAKWREESVSWNDFEAAFPSHKFDIYHAEIARREGSIAIVFAGSLVGEELDDRACSFHIRAGQIEMAQSNGAAYSAEHFLEMVKSYREWFGLQHPQ